MRHGLAERARPRDAKLPGATRLVATPCSAAHRSGSLTPVRRRGIRTAAQYDEHARSEVRVTQYQRVPQLQGDRSWPFFRK
jgi:hypothetical protein